MATFKVTRWKFWESSDPDDFYLVPPEMHPYSWLVPRWWYEGRTIYETCAQVQGPNYKMYIDGTTPAMEFEFEVNGIDLEFLNWKDVRRVVITESYDELLKDDGEFLDIELTVDNKWVARKNTLPEPIVDVPPVWIKDPAWVTEDIEIGQPVKAITGDYEGGMPPIIFRSRWQVRDQANATFSGGWTNVTPNQEITIADLDPEDWWPADYKSIRFQNQIRDTDPSTESVRTENKFTGWKTITTPAALAVDQASSWDANNLYEVDETVKAYSATFTGGIEPIFYQARMQKKDGDSWTSPLPWVTVSNAAVPYHFNIEEAGTYRLESMAQDSRGNTVSSYTEEKEAIVVVRSWGDVTLEVNDISLEFYPANIPAIAHEPVNLEVSYTGDAVAEVSWTVRNDVPVVFSDSKSLITTATFSWEGINRIMVTLHDPKADTPYLTRDLNFTVSD